MAARQCEDKMFQTHASINPEPREALSLSRGGRGKRMGETDWHKTHKTHVYDDDADSTDLKE